MRPLASLREFEMFAVGLDHPEGLAFDGDGTLWAGGELGQIYRIDSRGRARVTAELGGFCLGLTFSPSQDLWVCNSGKRALICLDRRGRVKKSVERAASKPLRNPNFSVFDSEGNLYFSDSGEWRKDDGYVYVLRTNGRTESFAGPLAFPNGLALSADERTLFVAQSTRDNVLAIRIREDGHAGASRIYARTPGRVPDGLALDAAGSLYVTCYASDDIYIVAPDGSVRLWACDPQGTMLARPTNIAFGGERRDIAYIANLGRWHLCRAKVRVPGMPLVHQRDGQKDA
jgi:gluconolactonase